MAYQFIKDLKRLKIINDKNYIYLAKKLEIRKLMFSGIK